jgi:hypothetical protein
MGILDNESSANAGIGLSLLVVTTASVPKKAWVSSVSLPFEVHRLTSEARSSNK